RTDTVDQSWVRDNGSTLRKTVYASSQLLAGHDVEQNVWMSHGDCVTAAPTGFRVVASSSASPVAAFEDPERLLYGVQWHPEVGHSDRGQEVLENFLHRSASLTPDWTT